jgi:hypothetical protein
MEMSGAPISRSLRGGSWPVSSDKSPAETSQLLGPGGIPLAPPDNPVTLPLHQDPIKSRLKPETGGAFRLFN